MPTLRLAAAAGIAALGVLAAAPAAAHVSADKSEVPAGGFTAVTLTVPHGCDTAATNELEIQIPASILNVTPEMVPGWDVAVEKTALAEPVEGPHGEQFTERESVVRYSARAGNELPHDLRLSFTIGFQAPDTPGEYLFFKTIQRCTQGETAWIEEYTGDGEEPDTPAPVVRVAEASGGHGASDDDHDAAAESDNDGDAATPIAIGGLVTGVLGLAAGGLALARTRSTP